MTPGEERCGDLWDNLGITAGQTPPLTFALTPTSEYPPTLTTVPSSSIYFRFRSCGNAPSSGSSPHSSCLMPKKK